MSHDILEIGKVAGSVVAVFSVVALAWKVMMKAVAGLRWIRGNCSWAMPEIEQSDPWWTPRDRNPIFSRRRSSAVKWERKEHS